jgi:hypothetical protein
MSSHVESPYGMLLAAPSPGIIRQELTTYEMKDGVVRRIVTTREFYGDELDYVDSQCVTIIKSR